MSSNQHTTRARDSGVFVDLDLDIDISEKICTSYSHYLGFDVPTKKSNRKEPEYEPFFTTYSLEVVLPPKMAPNTQIPFSGYLGLQTSPKPIKREHKRPQRKTSFYFVNLNDSAPHDDDTEPIKNENIKTTSEVSPIKDRVIESPCILQANRTIQLLRETRHKIAAMRKRN
ncbi:10720_t:CDS:2 [Cetraspora pellucida]|uniref:10720_t:CDS:1 n=1 Tax=Cetraspora pellucida TaxID=1433469 RepID=A0A9N9EXI5_9GLOM|nr:10720_t:CDS:2 [Cetraspora pellucida]